MNYTVYRTDLATNRVSAIATVMTTAIAEEIVRTANVMFGDSYKHWYEDNRLKGRSIDFVSYEEARNLSPTYFNGKFKIYKRYQHSDYNWDKALKQLLKEGK